MCKTLFITIFLYFSNLIASTRVLYSELYNEKEFGIVFIQIVLLMVQLINFLMTQI